MKLVFSHPTGNSNVRAAANGFAEAGILSQFYTGIALFKGSFLYHLSNFSSLSELRRRQFDTILQTSTKTTSFREAGRILANKIGMDKLTKHETGIFSIDSVYKSLDRTVAKDLKNRRSQVNAIYAYEDGALQSFQKAKVHGLTCFYDLPIGYWRSAKQILEREEKAWPGWANTLTGLKDSEEKLVRKDEELKLADRIFVASQFTAKTLKDFPGELAPVEVIPYGFPSVCVSRSYESFIRKRPLRLLFVGSLSQRKGIANLFAAVDSINPCFIELTVVGSKTDNLCNALDRALAKCKWIPSLPNAEVLQLMRSNDVLVFPSLFEGFGLVITEAMSQGTPVITTDRTAGPDLITHNENGWLIEAGSTEALKMAIINLLSKPELIKTAGQGAMETAKLRPWSLYGKEIAQAIMKRI